MCSSWSWGCDPDFITSPPMTFGISPVGTIIMLAGIYYGAQYGGATTYILVNIPGESTSVVTCLDGYQMAWKGRTVPALGISAFGSFIASTVGIIGLVFFAPVLARQAVRFGPPEYCSLIVMPLTFVTHLSRGSMVKALMMAGCGIILGTVGMDGITGRMCFTYGIEVLEDGIGVIPIVIGLFGITEILENVGLKNRETSQIYETRITQSRK